jgi:signal peptidase II
MHKFSSRFFIVVSLIWIADAITKIWAVDSLSNGETIEVLGTYLRFRLVYNTGGVFGTFQGNPMIFQFLTGFAIVFLFFYFIKTPEDSPLFRTSVSLIMGGAFGNFTDRFFRHGVVDFIDMGVGYYRWPTYNIADSFISTGAVLLAIAFYKIEKELKAKQSGS